MKYISPYCSICGLYEGALTTDCPGEKVSSETSDRIYKEGNLDFRNGEWVNEPNPTHQMWEKARKHRELRNKIDRRVKVTIPLSKEGAEAYEKLQQMPEQIYTKEELKELKDKLQRKEDIETLQQMFDAEALVVSGMREEGEQEIDERPLRALAAAIKALKEKK